MQTLFQKMRANRGRWIKPPIKAAEVQPAPEVPAVQPFMVVDGERYVEAPATCLCTGCAVFLTVGASAPLGCCDKYRAAARAAFGRDCDDRVIYIKAE